jgi:hypothetical protein
MRPAPSASRINLSWYLMDTETSARLAHVKPATVRSWHKRGHLHRYGTHNRALWDIREILARTTVLDS